MAQPDPKQEMDDFEPFIRNLVEQFWWKIEMIIKTRGANRERGWEGLKIALCNILANFKEREKNNWKGEVQNKQDSYDGVCKGLDKTLTDLRHMQDERDMLLEYCKKKQLPKFLEKQIQNTGQSWNTDKHEAAERLFKITTTLKTK